MDNGVSDCNNAAFANSFRPLTFPVRTGRTLWVRDSLRAREVRDDDATCPRKSGFGTVPPQDG
jgi:hypothetical protein